MFVMESIPKKTSCTVLSDYLGDNNSNNNNNTSNIINNTEYTAV